MNPQTARTLPIITADQIRAEQVQTDVSDFNPERKNIIRSGINVSIEYYTENGKNIATKVSTNGDELEPAPSFYKE